MLLDSVSFFTRLYLTGPRDKDLRRGCPAGALKAQLKVHIPKAVWTGDAAVGKVGATEGDGGRCGHEGLESPTGRSWKGL